jgi:hypothetical protein
MSYRTKIFLAVLAIVIPPVLALSVFSIYSMKEIGSQMLSRQRESFAARYNDRLRAWQSDFALQARLELEKIDLALQWQVAEVELQPEVDTGSTSVQANAARAHEYESLRRIGKAFERSIDCQFVTLSGKTLLIQADETLNDASCDEEVAETATADRDQELPRMRIAADSGGTGARIVFARSVQWPDGGAPGTTGMVLSADRLFNLLTFPDKDPSGSRVVLMARPDSSHALSQPWPIFLQANLDGIKEKQPAHFVPGGELNIGPNALEPLQRALVTGMGGVQHPRIPHKR